jgi:hypothetical protein
MRLHDPGLAGLLRNARAAQARIAALVARAVHAENTQSIHEPLVDTLNALTTAYENRLQGLRDHVPNAILGMLIVFEVFSSFTRAGHPAAKQPALRRAMRRWSRWCSA